MEQNNNPTQETLDQWHNDPANWKLGIFYYNKQDKRLMPPKRIKQLGWTVNFANPMSILALIVLVAAIWIVITFYKSM
ncbi:MAG: hypothetical protein IPO85_12065 [Saprospiraceae bacterium]|uniref:DUF5808 domain-containing protein n=1 Tax=Candidatus Defluviibacterium haderslevense TaxID=2981993 RepID=A0A9D7XEW6_9BACT|nr:hypothetical protein [Candidatus Defluviibacterium haderslevense]